MKKIISGIALLCALIAAAPSAQAGGFKVGPKVGLNINELSMSSKILDKDNRCGFNVGVDAQFTVPLLGVGADVSVMYTRRNFQTETPAIDGVSGVELDPVVSKSHFDYISIPVHFMYKLDLPAINQIVCPYVITGPDFAFRVSKKLLNDIQSKNTSVSWDFGIGVELIKHLQIGATYSLGMNKAMKYIPVQTGINTTSVGGNTNGWNITAAWMF